MIRVRCPHCGAYHALYEKQYPTIGLYYYCPDCEQEFRLGQDTNSNPLTEER